MSVGCFTLLRAINIDDFYDYSSTVNGNGCRTDRKKCKKSLSGGESRLGGDEGPRGRCKERIKRMRNAYVPDK